MLPRRPPLLPILALLLVAAPLAHAADPAPQTFPKAQQFEYKLPADYPLHWWVPQDLRCTYLVQEPQGKLAPDAPILIYMHMAGGHQEEGMGLAAGPTDPERICWDCLRRMLDQRGWLYVCPEYHEFDHLLQDLRERYGKRPVYVVGAVLGARAILEDVKAHAGDPQPRYAGVALLSPAIDLRYYPNDGGLGDLVPADFPTPVYLLAGTADGPVASVSARLFNILRAQGTRTKLVLVDGKRQGGAVAATNWQDLLDFLAPPASGPRTHEPAATPPKPAPAGRPTISTFPIAPEPKLVTYAPGFSYWVVEPFFPERFKPDSGVVVFLDADEPNRLRGLGYYGGEYDLMDRDAPATAAWQQLAVTLSNRGWLYVLPRKHRTEGLADDLTARYGKRPTYLIGVAEGGQAALDEAESHPGRYAGIMLMSPILDAGAVEKAAKPADLPPIYITTRASVSDPVTQTCRKLSEALKTAGKKVKLVELPRPSTARPVMGTDWQDVLGYLTAAQAPSEAETGQPRQGTAKVSLAIDHGGSH